MPQAIGVTDGAPRVWTPRGPGGPRGRPAEGTAQELPPCQCSMAIIKFRTKMQRSADVIDPRVTNGLEKDGLEKRGTDALL
jgi:hypothetical protein